MADLDPLLERMLDGTANADERATLARRLEADPAARTAWWAEVAFRSHLHDELAAARSEASGRRHIVRRRTQVRRRTWRARLLPALAAAAILAGAVAVWLLSSAPTATVPSTAPAVASLAGSFAGDRELQLGDGSTLSFQAASYRVETADGSRIRLLAGQVTAQVNPRPADHPLVIMTSHAEAVVVGTRFTLATDANSTLLRVEEGTVRLAGKAVGAGEAQLAGAWGLSGRTLYLQPEAGATLADACRQLNAGEAVVLAPGVHSRGGDKDALATIAVAATIERPARLQAAPGSTPTLQGQGWDVLRISGNHLIISGLGFASTPSGTGNGLVLVDGQDIRIAGCSFTGFGGDGLNARRMDGLVIEDCVIADNGARSDFGQGGLGIFRGAGTRDTLLRRLRLSGNRTGPTNLASGQTTGGHGLWIGRDGDGQPGGRLLVEGCLISGNGGPGLSANHAGAITVRDCRILGNGSGPVGDLRTQIAAVGDSQLDLITCVIAGGPGAGLLQLWPPARISQATGNQVWGGEPPGDGFTPLTSAPGATP